MAILMSWLSTNSQEPRLHHHHHDRNLLMPGLNRLSLSATVHCLTGCAIGEVLGMVLATAFGWGDAASIAVAVASPSSSATR